MRVRKIFFAALPYLLIAALLLAFLFYPAKEEQVSAQQVIRVWNVDTFEGGKGSRTSFLKSVARRAEKREEGLYFLVSSYTKAGAEAALAEGNRPDILSFGVGMGAFAEYALPLGQKFAGGIMGGDCLAYPWCRGGYALFCLEDDFVKEGNVAVSCGGSNLSVVSAALEGIAGDELPSLSAYSKFLGGEYRYLLGTHRDLCRFSARGVTVFHRALNKYCDLYQYVSLLSAKEGCRVFLEELLSEETSSRLSEIGMFPMSEGEWGAAERTVSVFSSDAALGEMAAEARGAKNLGKFLKNI